MTVRMLMVEYRGEVRWVCAMSMGMSGVRTSIDRGRRSRCGEESDRFGVGRTTVF